MNSKMIPLVQFSKTCRDEGMIFSPTAFRSLSGSSFTVRISTSRFWLDVTADIYSNRLTCTLYLNHRGLCWGWRRWSPSGRWRVRSGTWRPGLASPWSRSYPSADLQKSERSAGQTGKISSSLLPISSLPVAHNAKQVLITHEYVTGSCLDSISVLFNKWSKNPLFLRISTDTYSIINRYCIYGQHCSDLYTSISCSLMQTDATET